jgi:tetrapyrrole methylase family protein/MazG family protein
MKKGITILGLGPGEQNLLTVEAFSYIQELNEIVVRTKEHPVLQSFPEDLEIRSFDEFYNNYQSFEEVYRQIVMQVISLGQRPQGVTYAVPGHPLVAEATTPEIIRQAAILDIPVRIIEGMSFLEPVFSLLELDPLPNLAIVDALELGVRHYPPFSPSTPMLIAQIYSQTIASEVKLSLNSIFPDEHPVLLVHDAGTTQACVQSLQLYEIDRQPAIGLRTSLYVPPLDVYTSFEEFQEIVARLRAPDGCPWDREQTHQSLKRYLLEEAYELLDAIELEEPDKITEELGDLLLQILLHAQIGIEEGEFSMVDILSGIHQKIVRRHPHVFADTMVQDAQGVVHTWEKIKADERKEKDPDNDSTGMLKGLPRSLPALSQAQEIQERAARVGFDWETIDPVYEKVTEEFEETRRATDQKQLEAEIGDLLFAVVNLARWHKVDAEAALRSSGDRFRARFHHIERQAQNANRNLSEMSLSEMDRYWEEAKKLGM